MDCRIDIETIELYVDGELRGQDLARVEEALASDPETRRRVEFQQGLKGLVLAAEESRSVPDLVRKRLMKALEREAERSSYELVEAVADGELEADLLESSPETERRLEFQRQLKAMIRRVGESETTPAEVRERVTDAVESGQVFDLVETYVDGELDPEEHELFGELVSEHPDIEEQVAFQRSFKQMLAGAAAQEKVPAGVRERLLRRLGNESMEAPEEDGAAYDQVEAYVDGELEGEELVRFEEKLKSCAETARRVEFQRGLKASVRQSGLAQATPDLARRRILKALDEAAPAARPRRTARWQRPLLAAASIALVSMLAVLGLQRGPASPLVAAMAVDHHKCSQLRPLFPDADPVAAAQQTIGATPTMASLPGQLARYDVRMCPFPDDRRALHVLYRDLSKGETVVSLYGIPDEPGFKLHLEEVERQIDPHLASADGYNMALWKHEGWVYSLVSSLPADQVKDLAEHSEYTAFLGEPGRLLAMLGP